MVYLIGHNNYPTTLKRGQSVTYNLNIDGKMKKIQAKKYRLSIRERGKGFSKRTYTILFSYDLEQGKQYTDNLGNTIYVLHPDKLYKRKRLIENKITGRFSRLIHGIKGLSERRNEFRNRFNDYFSDKKTVYLTQKQKWFVDILPELATLTGANERFPDYQLLSENKSP